ncbi:MAG: hypothetical protein BWX79_02927 [Alphaproteobacteria bacterium ADurb.Bin100]|nr:MAG: hypothetical protein BWX79_02927 [Alphaproteobacteria bacterium ADurb.Bin100]
MNAPSLGMKYLPATSAMPSSKAASKGPVMDEVPPTATTIRKYTMNFSGKVGSSPSTSAPRAPPRPASPEPTAKVAANTTLTLMPRPAATRGSSTLARRRLPKRVLDRMN